MPYNSTNPTALFSPMMPSRYALTFACYNAIDYTKLCIESMLKHHTPLDRLIAVDNGSTDGTREYLQTLPLAQSILNQQNLGCGVAWNQGALALQAEWTIVMNNDVLVAPEWIEKLIGTAERIGVKVISPALIEGPLDYDFEAFEAEASQKMHNVHRIGARHAVCLAIHESVWMDVGYFQPVPKLLGYEDTLFFHELAKSNIQTAITGACWLHHYGSITQSLMKQERGLKQNQGLANRYNYKLLGQSFLRRKLSKYQRKQQEKLWAKTELAEFGMSLHGRRVKGEFEWS